MSNSLHDALSSLVGSKVKVSPDDIPASNGQAPVSLRFSTGADLKAVYWRIIKDRRAAVSSFDHEQIYGLPAHINAVDVLRDELLNRSVTAADLDHDSGDLSFTFSESFLLQVFNFSGYEIWELRFSDGTIEYSNYNK